MFRVIISFIHPAFDTHHFAYRDNRLSEDAVAAALCAALSHLGHQESYALLLFIDFSSAFNIIHAHWLVCKLSALRLHTFLTDYTQRARVGLHTSSNITVGTDSPQG